MIDFEASCEEDIKNMVDENGESTPYIFDPEHDKYYSFSRGNIEKVIHRHNSVMYNSISDYFTGIILGRNNQDVFALIIGERGSGKSSTTLAILVACAKKIALSIEGDESKWEKYYSIAQYTAIILEDEANRVMSIQTPFICKNLDDVSVAWNARSWRSDSNTAKNNILTINRVANQITFLSTPNSFLLDKVPRALVSHYLEMSDKHFAEGYVEVKLFKPQNLFRQNKIYHPYLAEGVTKYISYMIPRPSDDLVKEYDKLRKRNTEIVIREQQSKMDKSQVREIPKTASDIKHDTWKEWRCEARPMIDSLVLKGMEPERALYKLGRKKGLTRDAISYLIREGGVYG